MVIQLMFAVKRVHWLRACAQSMHWTEEFTFVEYEMRWTVNYFIYKSNWWKKAIANVGLALNQGQIAFAYRQLAMWHDMARLADKSFGETNTNYVRVM